MSSFNTVIGVDFFGAGNLGDDLMLAGFLTGSKYLGLAGKLGHLEAICSYDRNSQAIRFPEIKWIDGNDDEVCKAAIKRADAILGIGGTPFQMTVGDWLLKIIEEIIALKRNDCPFAFVNVGAENEAECEKASFQEVLKNVVSISVRDADSMALLARWRGSNPKPELIPGPDLAHISLRDICAEHPPISLRPQELGLVVGHDTLGPDDVETILSWLIQSRRTAAWITCEVRNMAGGEYQLYLKNRHRFDNIIFRYIKPRIRLHRPRYQTCSLAELVQPFSLCQTVLSTRYHGILSAAWSGCRVGGIARSSKVKWLCKQLRIPMIEPPFTREAMSGLLDDAVVVAKSDLEHLRDQALEGIRGSLKPFC
jgi:Polysaccharide pyruvyl transferase